MATCLPRGARLWTSVVAALLLAACAQLPTRPASGPIVDVPLDVAAPAAQALSPVFATAAARRETVARVWSLIDERFYDPRFNGVDWSALREPFLARAESATSDTELYAALKAMARTLRDSHTQVLTPREAVDRRRFMATRVGLNLGWIEGRLAVLEVEADSPAAAAGLRPGDVIRAVNDTHFDEAFLRTALNDDAPALVDQALGEAAPQLPPDPDDADRERITRAVREVIRKAVGTPPWLQMMTLEIEDHAGATRNLALTATSSIRPPTAQFRRLDGGIALIRFSRFLPQVRGEIERALNDATDAHAIIVDLRGNGGGLFEFYRWFAGRFLPESREVMRTVRRERAAQRATSVRAGPGPYPPLTQPVAVLVDARTGSAAELAAITLLEQRGALLIGDPTCGCVVGVRTEYVLPDGGGVRISETGFLSPRGARMEGQPTVPAIRVRPTLADLRAGRDAALLVAQQRLLDSISASASVR